MEERYDNMFAESKAVSDNILKTMNRGQLPPCTKENPKHVNAINLRSGTVVPKRKAPEVVLKRPEPEVVRKKKSDKEIADEIAFEEFFKPTKHQNSGSTPEPVWEIPPPFPSRTSAPKQKEGEKEFLDVFGKVSVNMPMLDLVTKVSA